MSSLLYKISFLLVSLVITVITQDFIRVDAPAVNEVVTSRRVFNIQYTVLGYRTVSPPLPKYYPTSLSIDFAWKEQNNAASNIISIQLATGLYTVPYTDGTLNIENKEAWKLPNCRFFSRYPPTLYDFSLVFTPVYQPVANVTGSKQKPIVVPLSIVVDNSTFPRC